MIAVPTVDFDLFDVISFDIFDTLLLRPFVRPTDLFLLMEKRYGARGFSKQRRAAERKALRRARAQGREECTIDEIYSLIPRFGALKEREMEFESEYLRPNVETIAWYKEAKRLGKKVVIVSDMYLPRDFLERVLQKNGIDGWDGLYVSSDVGVRKTSGSLYRKMLKDQGVDSGAVLHIGDDQRGDVESAATVGILPHGYEKVIDSFFREFPFAKFFLEGHDAIEQRLFVGTLACGWHTYRALRKTGPIDGIVYVCCGVIGYTYARFIAEGVRENNINHLLMIARDGYILKEIIRTLVPRIELSYVYAPRIVEIVGYSDWAHRYAESNVRVREWIVESTGAANVWTDEETSEYVKSGLVSPRLISVVEDYSRKVREEYAAYIRSLGITDLNHTAIVDITSAYRSGERLLEHAFGREILTFYMLLYRKLPKPSHVKCLYHGGTNALIFDRFCEYFFTAPHPTVVGIDGCKPVYDQVKSMSDGIKQSRVAESMPVILDCVKALQRTGGLSREDLVDWMECFYAHATSKDLTMMASATENNGVREMKRVPVLLTHIRERRPLFKIFGRTLIGVRTCVRGNNKYLLFYLLNRIKFLRIPRPF